MRFSETVIECSYEECVEVVRVRDDALTDDQQHPVERVLNEAGWKTLRWMGLGRGRGAEREYCAEHWATLSKAVPTELRDNMNIEVSS